MKKATIKTKNPYTFPTYTVMQDGLVVKAFYSKQDAIKLRNELNKQVEPTKNVYMVGMENTGCTIEIKIYKNGSVIKTFVKDEFERVVEFMNFTKTLLAKYTENTITEFPFNY